MSPITPGSERVAELASSQGPIYDSFDFNPLNLTIYFFSAEKIFKPETIENLSSHNIDQILLKLNKKYPELYNADDCYFQKDCNDEEKERSDLVNNELESYFTYLNFYRSMAKTDLLEKGFPYITAAYTVSN